MYKITFKGAEQESVIMDEISGRALYDDFLSNKMETKIEIGKGIYLSSSIKSIARQNDSSEARHSATREMYDEIERDYSAYRKERLALNPMRRAQSLSLARLVWWAHVGAEIPKSAEAQIILKQKEFFQENPHNIYANPICYKKLIPKSIKVDHTKVLFSAGAMRFVEITLAMDMRLAQKA